MSYLLYQLLCGIKHLHSAGIIHRVLFAALLFCLLICSYNNFIFLVLVLHISTSKKISVLFYSVLYYRTLTLYILYYNLPAPSPSINALVSARASMLYALPFECESASRFRLLIAPPPPEFEPFRFSSARCGQSASPEELSANRNSAPFCIINRSYSVANAITSTFEYIREVWMQRRAQHIVRRRREVRRGGAHGVPG